MPYTSPPPSRPSSLPPRSRLHSRARSASPAASHLSHASRGSRGSRGSAREAELAPFSHSSTLPLYRTFDSMHLKPSLLRGIYSAGFSSPSPIQQRCIVPLVKGKDVVAQAQSGTGKSVMIAIAALQIVSDKRRNVVEVIVLSPTRELAVQTAEICQEVGEFSKAGVWPLVGGTSVGRDITVLEAGGVDIVSGTPGRVLDMVTRGVLNLRSVRLFVVDEADVMMEDGLKEQVYDVFRSVRADVQVAMVSATMGTEVVELSRRIMNEPVMVLVKKEGLSLGGLRQFYVDVEKESWKFETLCDIYGMVTITQAVIFCNTQARVDSLARNLRRHGFEVGCVHSAMPMKDREACLHGFRSGDFRVLVATDLWARGLDVKQVSLVINYDMPAQYESYLHRIGRSGRFGKAGVSITFVTNQDMSRLEGLERFYATRIAELPSNVDDYL